MRLTATSYFVQVPEVYGLEFAVRAAVVVGAVVSAGLNVAVTLTGAFTVTPQVPVPAQPPSVHPVNADPGSATAVKLLVLVTSVTVALITAFSEYFTAGEFFALRDISHHETFEVVAIAFGVGVFVAALAFDLRYGSLKSYLVRQPITASVLPSPFSYSQIIPYVIPQQSPTQSPLTPEIAASATTTLLKTDQSQHELSRSLGCVVVSLKHVEQTRLIREDQVGPRPEDSDLTEYRCQDL